MKQGTDNPKNSGSSRSGARSNEPSKVEVSLDLDDIVGIAIFDSVLRAKRRRFKSRSSSRRK